MRRLREGVRWGRLGVLTVLGVVAVCIAVGRDTALAHLAALDLVVGVGALCLILASCRDDGRIRRALSWKPFVVVGAFSYSLYLIHAPLLQVVWQYGVHPLGLGASATFALLVLVGVPLVVAASYGFFLAFERPFLSAEHRARLGVEPRRRRERVAVSVPLPSTPPG
jgi:peptidoglycan/LPS O-acetylase OafA/YrhL